MTADQLRRYIAEAEKLMPTDANYPMRTIEQWRQHKRNASPELFVALCRLALATMDLRAWNGERIEDYVDHQESVTTALYELNELPDQPLKETK